MSKLTPKQEKFCRGIADGLSQSDAYRNAYNCKKSQPATIQNKASAMCREDRIKARITELRQSLQKKDLWKREDSVSALIDVIMHDPSAKAGDRVRAVGELNKMHGWQSSTVDLTNSDKTLQNRTINHFYANSKPDS